MSPMAAVFPYECRNRGICPSVCWMFGVLGVLGVKPSTRRWVQFAQNVMDPANKRLTRDYVAAVPQLPKEALRMRLASTST